MVCYLGKNGTFWQCGMGRQQYTFLFRYFSSNCSGGTETPVTPTPALRKVQTEIDLGRLRNDLSKVNIFAKNREKLPPLLMYEICHEGKSIYKSMTHKSLERYVHKLTKEIEASRSHVKSGWSKHYSSIFDADHGGDVSISDLHPNVAVGEKAINKHMGGSVSGAESEDEFQAGGELNLRDLHRLDLLFNVHEEKSILVRRHAVLFAMDPVRAIVMADRVLILCPSEGDPLIEVVGQFLKEWVSRSRSGRSIFQSDKEWVALFGGDVNKVKAKEKPKPTGSSEAKQGEGVKAKATDVSPPIAAASEKHGDKYDDDGEDDDSEYEYLHRHSNRFGFELHAYEALLTVIKSLEFQEYDAVKAQVKEVVAGCEQSSLLPLETQERMRKLKNDLSRMLARVGSSQRVLQAVAEDDEEMAMMNLTVLKNKPELYLYPLSAEILSTHDDIQELLESYLIDFNSLASKLMYLRSQIQSAEELVAVRLDTSRNELLVANTTMAVVACSIGFSGYLSGVFGMNLDNAVTLSGVSGGFATVFLFTLGLIPGLSYSAFIYLRQTAERGDDFEGGGRHKAHHSFRGTSVGALKYRLTRYLPLHEDHHDSKK